MKTLLRDRKKVFYANPTGETDKTDSYGNITAVPDVSYSKPVCYDKLSAAKVQGAIKAEAFGLTGVYQTSFVTSDMKCPFQVDTRLWIDTPPYDNNGNVTPHNYVVKAMIPSINCIRVIVEEVSVS